MSARHCIVTGGRCTCPECAASSPPAAPELPEGWAFDTKTESFVWKSNFTSHRQLASLHISLERICALLATQGLTIVDAKDRAVLDGVARLVAEWIEQGTVDQEDPDVSMQQIERLLGDRVQAALARRGEP